MFKQTMGIVLVAFLAARASTVEACDEHVHF